MPLNHLRKGRGEPGVPLDVRALRVNPEKNPANQGRFKLPEEEFDDLLEKASNHGWQYDKCINAGRLIYLFPEQKEKICALATLRDFQRAIEKTRFDLEVLSFGKKLYPESNLLPIVNPEMRLKMTEKIPNERERLKKLAHFKVLFFNYDLNNSNDYWELGKRILHEDALTECWSLYVETAALLRILFPGQYQEIVSKEFWNDCLASLSAARHAGDEGHTYLSTAFYLAILDADEIIIDEQGLHLINHPNSGSIEIEAGVPAQPEVKQI